MRESDAAYRESVGNDIAGAYIAASYSDSWGEQVLTFTIPSGETRDIVFLSPNPGSCDYDLHVTSAEGGTWEIQGLDLCVTSVVELSDTELVAH